MMTLPFFDYEVYSGNLNDLADRFSDGSQTIINTINPHSFYVADKDEKFKSALQRSHILLPDGIGIVYANLLMNRSLIRRIAGIDIFYFILKSMEDSTGPANKKAFFLGSSDEVLSGIKQRLKKEFPSIEAEFLSPPYKSEFSEEDNNLMTERINSFKPFALFVGMTAPKQEKWVLTNHHKLDAKIICSIGAVFDFYSGAVRRPNAAWRALGLEWLRRLSREPRRLWRRSFISLPYFLAKVIKATFAQTTNNP